MNENITVRIPTVSGDEIAEHDRLFDHEGDVGRFSRGPRLPKMKEKKRRRREIRKSQKANRGKYRG